MVDAGALSTMSRGLVCQWGDRVDSIAIGREIEREREKEGRSGCIVVDVSQSVG